VWGQQRRHRDDTDTNTNMIDTEEDASASEGVNGRDPTDTLTSEYRSGCAADCESNARTRDPQA
jgi:hypothetical protein